MKKLERTHQCRKCPWKKSTDPREIPNGYSKKLHRGLRRTIAKPGYPVLNGDLHVMACHESPLGSEQYCVGWLHHQLGVGNNILLRLSMRDYDCRLQLDGPQHESFEDTLPKN